VSFSKAELKGQSDKAEKKYHWNLSILEELYFKKKAVKLQTIVHVSFV
jgi:hypothetical protein